METEGGSSSDGGNGKKGPSKELLDDIAARFILSSPKEELEDPMRALSLAERAHWFYEDHCRSNDPELCKLSLKRFARMLFERAPMQSVSLNEAFRQFSEYKREIPVCGAAIFDDNLEHCLMVRHCNSKTWSFPRGKISHLEAKWEAACREVKEETGLDIETLIDKNNYLERSVQGKSIRLYFISGVSREKNQVHPLAANEIEEAKWLPISYLRQLANGKRPSDFKVLPTVLPFAKPLIDMVQKLRGRSSESTLADFSFDRRKIFSALDAPRCGLPSSVFGCFGWRQGIETVCRSWMA